MKTPTILLVFTSCLLTCPDSRRVQAAIVVSEFFTGRIQSFDETTKTESTLAFVAGNPGLSGLAYSQSENTLYASALNHGGVYRFNAQTGSLLGFSSLGIGPGGLSIASNGDVYISDFASSNIRIYDSTLTNQLGLIATPAGPTSGVGFLGNGNVLISTAGSGVYEYDGENTTLFANNPAASAQIATDSSGNVFIGHGLGFSDSVFRYDEDGNILGTFDISAEMINSTGNGSSIGTSPGGITFDPQGNLLVAALGRSNPSDPGGERGGLFMYDVDGNLLETFAAGSNALSSVVFVTAIPEPGFFTLLAFGAVYAISNRRNRRII
ncbi:hypothetical protein [Roseiconus lacunae]|uniref:PEP-CTERM protein-sorting domain-containing protein n=1 Tax=Roseiconus lacunae TaxID=2605694 RepID=A0ABT7PS91_9BACT|nr:hypothetical protein [Roseiconus lacunae]MDM4019365.1 hypothetical protein [Roseiconus lacunae]